MENYQKKVDLSSSSIKKKKKKKVKKKGGKGRTDMTMQIVSSSRGQPLSKIEEELDAEEQPSEVLDAQEEIPGWSPVPDVQIAN